VKAVRMSVTTATSIRRKAMRLMGGPVVELVAHG
jgi:hypothetical protein